MFTGSISTGALTIPIRYAPTEYVNVATENTPLSSLLSKSLDLRLGRANSFHVPLHDTAHAWVLVKRADLDTLDLNARYSVTFTADSPVPTSMIWQNLVICREPQVVLGNYIGEDPVGAVMVELADVRWLLKNPGFSVPINTQYNVRNPLSQADGAWNIFYDDSLNNRAQWTWAGMIGDVWAVMGTWLGTFPGLPFTPDGTPEGWNFTGMAAWDALTLLLQRIGCAVRADLTQNAGSQFTIVRVGAGDTGVDDALAGAAGRKLHDGEFQTIIRGKQPRGVCVLFRSAQWTTNRVYSINIDGPNVTDTEPGIYTPIWDDLIALFDDVGACTNVAALTTRATERGIDYCRTLTAQGGERLWQRYSGFLDITPGSTLKGVRWVADHLGVWTDVVQHPLPCEEKGVDDLDAMQAVPWQRPGTPVETMLALSVGSISPRTISTQTLTTLDGGIDSSQLTMTVNSTFTMPVGVPFVVTVNTEDILVIKPASGNVVTILKRPVNDTVADTHADASLVVWERITAGEGTCTLYRMVDMPDSSVDFMDTYQEVTVYNQCPSTIPDDVFVDLYREPFSGKLIVNPQCGVAFIHGEGSGSGEPGFGPCEPCAVMASSYCAPFPGLTNPGACSPCTDTGVGSLIGGVTLLPIAACQFVGSIPLLCEAFSFPNAYVELKQVFTTELKWRLTAYFDIPTGAFDTTMAYYEANAAGWDCNSPLVVTKVASQNGQCANWPATVTIQPGPCAGSPGGSWLDTFTAGDGTALNSHNPDTPPAGVYTNGAGTFTIGSNRLAVALATNSTRFFAPPVSARNLTTALICLNRLTVDLEGESAFVGVVVRAEPQAGLFPVNGFECALYAEANSGVLYASIIIEKITAGVAVSLTEIDISGLVIPNSRYILKVSNGVGSITFDLYDAPGTTILATVSVTDSDYNTNTGVGIIANVSAATGDAPFFDDLTVNEL